jgi:hypothetical protein
VKASFYVSCTFGAHLCYRTENVVKGKEQDNLNVVLGYFHFYAVWEITVSRECAHSC